MSIFVSDSDALCSNSYSLDSSIFWRVEIKENNNYVVPDLGHNLTVVCTILKGEIAIYNNNLISSIVKKDEAALVTNPSDTVFRALSETIIILCSLTRPEMLCPCYLFQNLGRNTNFNYDFNLLKINDQVKSFLSAMDFYLMEGIDCSQFHELKRKELFFLFRAYYSDSELISFFFPVIGQNSDFKLFILNNYLKVANINDFANLACCSLSTFNRKFKENFGVTAYQWLLNQKAKYIYNEIVYNTNSFQEIAFENGFSSQAHFNHFCKSFYGKTPGKIRKDKNVSLCY